MTDLFANPNFITMVKTIAFWAVMYGFIRILLANAGIGTDLLKQATKRISGLRKATMEFRLLCSEREGSDKISKQIRLLGKIIRREKKISKILGMYLFDDKNDLDVAGAKKKVDAIPDICREIIVQCSEGEMNNTSELFNTVDTNIKEALALIEKAISIDLKKKLLKI